MTSFLCVLTNTLAQNTLESREAKNKQPTECAPSKFEMIRHIGELYNPPKHVAFAN